MRQDLLMVPELALRRIRILSCSVSRAIAASDVDLVPKMSHSPSLGGGSQTNQGSLIRFYICGVKPKWVSSSRIFTETRART